VGHIEKRGDKRWKARYRNPRDPSKELSQTFTRKADAEGWLTARLAEIQRGEWVDPRRGKTSLGEWADRWFKSRAALKPTTRAGYEALLRNQILPRFGSQPLARIQPIDVSEWVAKLTSDGLSSSRTRQAYHLLGQIMAAAVRSGYIAKTPCVGVRLPKPTRSEMRFLGATDVERLASRTDSRYVALVRLLAYGGPRWGEAAALRRGRCNLLRARIEIAESLADVGGKLYFGPTKTYQTRTLALPRFLRDDLAKHMQNVADDPDALVFTSPDGGPLRLPNFRRRVWFPALERAGLGRLRIHDLRHTAAALLIAQGAHPKAVQTHLGHSSITVTMDRYGHLFPDDMDRLADALDAAHAEALAAPPRPDGDLARLPEGGTA
jgi:integrase